MTIGTPVSALSAKSGKSKDISRKEQTFLKKIAKEFDVRGLMS